MTDLSQADIVLNRPQHLQGFQVSAQNNEPKGRTDLATPALAYLKDSNIKVQAQIKLIQTFKIGTIRASPLKDVESSHLTIHH